MRRTRPEKALGWAVLLAMGGILGASSVEAQEVRSLLESRNQQIDPAPPEGPWRGGPPPGVVEGWAPEGEGYHEEYVEESYEGGPPDYQGGPPDYPGPPDWDEAAERRHQATISMLMARAEKVQVLLEAGRLEPALKELDGMASIEGLGDDPETWDVIGGAFQESADFLGGEERWKEAVEVLHLGLKRIPEERPMHGDLLMNLGGVYRSMGEVDRALKVLDEAARFFDRSRHQGPPGAPPPPPPPGGFPGR